LTGNTAHSRATLSARRCITAHRLQPRQPLQLWTASPAEALGATAPPPRSAHQGSADHAPGGSFPDEPFSAHVAAFAGTCPLGIVKELFTPFSVCTICNRPDGGPRFQSWTRGAIFVPWYAGDFPRRGFNI
jgi:hypothetical protein